MYFNVSKMKFIINELFTSLLIPFFCTLLILFFKINLAMSSIFWLWGILFFFFKIDLYWRDQVYINENYIKLNRIKISGAHELIFDNTVEENEYVIENLHKFKETPTKFILYGDAHVENKDSIGTINRKSLVYNGSKNIKRIVIRKNFKENKKIRELLNKAVI